MPARASTSPSRASRTAAPPKVPPSAAAAASWIAGSIVVRTGSPFCGSVETSSSRSPPPTASSSPPGVPARRSSNASSRPLVPASEPSGKPRASSAARCSPFGSEISPVTMPPAPLVTRASAGPSASAERSAARIAARSGSRVLRSTRWPGSRPGKTRWGAQSMPSSPYGNRDLALDRPERGRVDGHREGEDLRAVLIERPARLAGADRIDGRRGLRPPRRPPRAPRRRRRPPSRGSAPPPSPRSRPRSRHRRSEPPSRDRPNRRRGRSRRRTRPPRGSQGERRGGSGGPCGSPSTGPCRASLRPRRSRAMGRDVAHRWSSLERLPAGDPGGGLHPEGYPAPHSSNPARASFHDRHRLGNSRARDRPDPRGLPAGVPGRGARPRRLRGRRVPRREARAAAPRRRIVLAVRAGDRPARRSPARRGRRRHRRGRRAFDAGPAPRGTAGGRFDRRSGGVRRARARARLGCGGAGPARARAEGGPRRRPAFAHPRRPQRRAAALGRIPERPQPHRSDAAAGGPERRRRSHPRRGSPRTPRSSPPATRWSRSWARPAGSTCRARAGSPRRSWWSPTRTSSPGSPTRRF